MAPRVTITPPQYPECRELVGIKEAFPAPAKSLFTSPSKKTDDGNKIRENYYHLFAIYKFDDDILCEYFVTIHSMETACQIHFSLSLFSPSAAKFHQDQCIVRS